MHARAAVGHQSLFIFKRFHLVVLALVLSAGCAEEPATPPANPQASSPSAPAEVTLASADQAKLQATIAAHKGEVVLVDFWATWCGPCMEKFPSIVKLHERYGGQGLAVISVSLDAPDEQTKVLATLREQHATMTNFLTSLEFTSSFDAFQLGGALPEYHVYDRAGNLAATFKVEPSAARQFTVDDIAAKVEELLAQKPPE